jgi:DNA (cytosine-5)-methyltransferase 1
MRVIDLFSGIGGFSLALERVGMVTTRFCEIDPFCQAILKKHWPEVPIYGDVRSLPKLERIDLICGGFPCQDISIAGAGAGLAGERSGLWREFARIIGDIRPRYVIVENVAALLGRGLSTVLGDLAALGYDAEWDVIPASAVGLPHRRERVWIVAYPSNNGCKHAVDGEGPIDPGREILARLPIARSVALNAERFRDEVRAASFVRTANGIPDRVDRVTALGNSIVPQIPEMIGRAIMPSERTRS